LPGRATGIGSIVADEKHHERFAEAVERKKKDSKEASEQTSRADGGSEIEGDQNDTGSPRTQGTRHKKVTADKWNQ
jgi:hypothetical protein